MYLYDDLLIHRSECLIKLLMVMRNLYSKHTRGTKKFNNFIAK